MSASQSSCPSCGAPLIYSQQSGVPQWSCPRCGFERRSWAGRVPRASSNSIDDIGEAQRQDIPSTAQPSSYAAASPISYPKFCRNCGASLAGQREQGTKFCPNCGNPIARPSQSRQTNPKIISSPPSPSFQPQIQNDSFNSKEYQRAPPREAVPYDQPRRGERYSGQAVIEERLPPREHVSSAWYLVPFFFAFVGGIIAWAVNKSRDAKKARNFIIFGFVWTVVIGLIIVFAFSAALFGFANSAAHPTITSENIIVSCTNCASTFRAQAFSGSYDDGTGSISVDGPSCPTIINNSTLFPTTTYVCSSSISSNWNIQRGSQTSWVSGWSFQLAQNGTMEVKVTANTGTVLFDKSTSAQSGVVDGSCLLLPSDTACES